MASKKTLDTQISTLQQTLNTEKSNRSELINSLKQTEITSGKLTQSLQHTQEQLTQQNAQLKTLNQQKAHYQAQLTQQQQSLSVYIQAAYTLGPQPFLKILLQEPQKQQKDRMLTYYHALTQQQAQHMNALKHTLNELQHTQARIIQQQNTLSSLKKAQNTQKVALSSAKKKREALIHSLDTNIQSKQSQLATYLKTQQALSQTLGDIATTDKKGEHIASIFQQHQGKLPWPIKGRISTQFGTQIKHSELRWGGTLIKAPLGQPVKAIATGQVVFAKWLEGYGLLLIINHDDGYMTLYGRNQVLYKKAGDLVHRGDIIARVGQSGGFKEPALYFAIRHNATPLNPNRWCHKL